MADTTWKIILGFEHNNLIVLALLSLPHNSDVNSH